jgi:hypothetical protein
MEPKEPDVVREGPDPRWDDDPYRGVDVTMMQELLKMTPAQRLRYAVQAANFMMKARAAAQRR